MNAGGVATFAFFNLQLARQVQSGRAAQVEALLMFLTAMQIVSITRARPERVSGPGDDDRGGRQQDL
jgi:hypothetical protein